MPQLIGRGETDRSSVTWPVPASAVWEATVAVVRSRADTVLDSHSRQDLTVKASTRVSALGWGETLTARVVDLGTSSRLELCVRGRHRGQVLQPQRNRWLLGSLTRSIRREVLRPRPGKEPGHPTRSPS